MCLLTYLPEMVQPDIAALRRGAISNDDGHGFAIVIPEHGPHGKILVRKSMTVSGLLKEFESLRQIYPSGPAIFHSRITTHGETDLFNCHPFMHSGDKRTVIGHNGVLPKSVQPRKGDPRSDTRIFAEQVADQFRLHTIIGRDLAAEWMGSWNKMVILTVDPDYDDYAYILNEENGIWENGIWYSNGSFRGAGARGYGSGYTYKYAGSGEWEKWEWCTIKGCPSTYASISPTSLRCRECGCCSICESDPCLCVLAEFDSGKGQSGQSASEAENRTEGTIVIGSPKSGATVKDATNWHEDYEASANDYWNAFDVARRLAEAGNEIDYDLNPDDDPADGRSQLEQVLAMVDHLNNGGDIEDLPPRQQHDMLKAALSVLERSDRLATTEFLAEPVSDTPQEEHMPVGWPPESDAEPRSDVGGGVVGAVDLIKRGDHSDDQEALMIESAARGLWRL